MAMQVVSIHKAASRNKCWKLILLPFQLFIVPITPTHGQCTKSLYHDCFKDPDISVFAKLSKQTHHHATILKINLYDHYLHQMSTSLLRFFITHEHIELQAYSSRPTNVSETQQTCICVIFLMEYPYVVQLNQAAVENM